MHLVETTKLSQRPSSDARRPLATAPGQAAKPASSGSRRDRSFAGKLVSFVGDVISRSWTTTGRSGRRDQLRVVETLHLGIRKQVLLISCAGERFLVGTGADSVDAIVRLRPLADGDDRGSFSRRSQGSTDGHQ